MKLSKSILFVLMLLVVVMQNVTFSQDIINILGPGGVFKIKDGATDFFTLSQTSGQVNILNSLRLENTTNSTTGIIFKGTQSFLHNYGTYNTFTGAYSGNFTMSGGYNSGYGALSLYSNTTGFNNSAFGYYSLIQNTTGNNNAAFGNFSLLLNSSGYQNSAFGGSSLYSNSSGKNNSAFGYYSLLQNTTGNNNSAFGSLSLYSNTTGSENAAFGLYTLYSNTTGMGNIGIGSRSLYFNTIGYSNIGLGGHSLYSNSTGHSNSAVGCTSLFLNTIGFSNTAIGDQSLYNNTTGNYNTAIGLQSLYLSTTGSNNIGIGSGATVPDGTGSNQVRIGNTYITYAGIQVAWTITSDKRWKQNILSSNLGLGFISKLNPVSYTRINDESGKTEYGLIAQDVEEVLKDEGVNNSGMLTVTDEGMYELRYNDLLAPMIKAIQELNAKCDSLQNENTVLTGKLNEVNELKEKLIKLSVQVENLNSKTDELKSASANSNIKENNLQVISYENTK